MRETNVHPVIEDTAGPAAIATMGFVLDQERRAGSLISLYSVLALAMGAIALLGLEEGIIPHELAVGAFAAAVVFLVGAIAAAVAPSVVRADTHSLSARLASAARYTGYVQLVGAMAPLIALIAIIVVMRG